MNSGVIQQAADVDNVGQDEMAVQLAALTRIINDGRKAQTLRKALIRRAVYTFGWTHEQAGAACPITQSAVTQMLKQMRTPLK